MENILLTGFGPFGSHTENVTDAAVRGLEGQLVGPFTIASRVLPVQFERAVAALEEAFEAERPAAVIACGIHDGQGYRVEVAAKNERDYAIPDVDGVTVRGEPVEPAAPPMAFATLPVAAIKASLEAEGLEAQLCEDAGRYLCNAVFYWVTRRGVPAGFLHVPAGAPAEEVARALTVAARVTADRLVAQRVEATA